MILQQPTSFSPTLATVALIRSAVRLYLAAVDGGGACSLRIVASDGSSSRWVEKRSWLLVKRTVASHVLRVDSGLHAVAKLPSMPSGVLKTSNFVKKTHLNNPRHDANSETREVSCTAPSSMSARSRVFFVLGKC